MEVKDSFSSSSDYRRSVIPRCSSLNLSVAMILIRGGTVYTPQHIGKMDVLIAGTKILRILHPADPEAELLAASRLTAVLNATGAIVAPGLVDIHVHVTGGGGEAGPASRVPEAPLSQLLRGGLTTVVGVLGLDSVTRSPDVLLSKVPSPLRPCVRACACTCACACACACVRERAYASCVYLLLYL